MYTLLVDDENQIIGTIKERIIQRSKNVNTIKILASNTYKGRDMKKCLAMLYYRLPVSGEWHSKELTPEDELYQDEYVQYIFPADTWLTCEHGDVMIEMAFYDVSMGADIAINQYVRKATNGIIHISSSKDWASGLADSLLGAVDQKIIQLMMAQNRQEEILEETKMSSASSLLVENGQLYLVNERGGKMSVAPEVVVSRTPDTNDSANDGLIELDNFAHDDSNSDCNCGCDCSDGNFEELDNYVATPSEDEKGNFSEL